MAEFAKLHAYRCNPSEKAALERLMFGVDSSDGAGCSGAKLNADIVGQSPVWIAEHAGFSVPRETSIILAEVSSVGRHEPLTREKLCPVLAVLRAESADAGITLAEQMVELDGLGHSAAIHTENEALAIEFGRRVKAVRILRDSPSTMGGIGDVYNALVPSMTLGCGSYGHNSVSGNVSAINLINIKRVARRNNNLQWFKVPSKTYFEPNAIRYLVSMLDVTRVTIVTDSTMTRLGFRRQDSRRAGPQAAAGRPADHRFGRAGAVHHHRLPRGRTDAGVQAGHHHRARRRVADGRRQGDVAAVRAPRGEFLRPEGEVLRYPQARLPLPEARRPRPAGVHPDHIGHRRRGDAVRRHHRSRDRHEIPAGRLRADPDDRHHRPGADREDAGVAGRRFRIRRADPRDRGLRLGLRQRLHRWHGAAGDPADLRQHRDVGQRAAGRARDHRGQGEDAQCRDDRRNGLRQRVSRDRARDGAHHRGEVPPGARPHERHPAAGRHPLQRHHPDQADQLAEVRVLRCAGTLSS